MSRLRTPLIAALFPLLAATLPAAAAEAGAAPQAFASREQLRHCMATEAELKTRAAAIATDDQARDRLLDQVTAETKQLAAKRQKLEHDGHHDADVKDFNKFASLHNVHVRQLNKATAAARPVAQAYKADKAVYNQACAGQSYRAEDMAAVTQERAKAASAP